MSLGSKQLEQFRDIICNPELLTSVWVLKSVYWGGHIFEGAKLIVTLTVLKTKKFNQVNLKT